MVWLHTAEQSMDAILLDKWNESLLILSYRKEIDPAGVRVPKAAMYWDINRNPEGNKTNLEETFKGGKMLESISHTFKVTV